MVSLTNFRKFGEMAPEDASFEPDYVGNNHQRQQNNLNTINSKHPKDQKRRSLDKTNQKKTKKFTPNNNYELNFDKPASITDKQGDKKDHFEIRWSNLNYQVEPKWYHRMQSSLQTQQVSQQQPMKKSILCNLNGSVRSGEVTAILGPSGAGKTSLLGCLMGKNKSGVSGSVQVISKRKVSPPNSSITQLGTLGAREGGSINGYLHEQESDHENQSPMSICTIPQKDFLLNQLTVRENLWFASRLKHPEENFDHDSNIERVVDLLKLDTCIDTKISKISGGQYKRVSIAQELLSNPDILILDEPTSGLDSLTCYKTVMVLRDLARLSPNPMAIIVTIHQPQREVFELFNHVYILATGGRCIYEGRPSQSIKTINESSGGLHFEADQYNPASYLVEIASSEFGEKPIEALVEHQRREFKRRVLDQLFESLQLNGTNEGANQMDAQRSPQQQQLQMAAVAAGLTPMTRKRAQSPMVARFKSTLSSLAGLSSAQTGDQSPKMSASKQQHHQFAYANEGYDNTGPPNDELPVVTVSMSGEINKENQAPNYPEALDATRLNGADSQQDLLTGTTDNHNTTTTTNKGTVNSHNNNLVYQFASQQFDNKSNLSTESNNEFYLDGRLQTHKHNHKGHFLRHCQLLTKRSWLCLCKDPMLTTLRFSAHIIVPLLITIVYGNKVGKPNACPLYESNMDLIEYARTGAKKLLNLQDELRCTFENVGLYFLSIYAFTFSTMCLTSLSFPLNMHVLLKEVRNGWYSIPTYFIGKTLADFPLEFILPTLTLMITYPLTGQPSSYLEWRFILATSIFVITSLIAQTQGLIFGALFMNAMQAAVFVAPVSTTPLILLSGFLIRISQMPIYLQKLSTLSYFRYAIESLTIIRYGFGQCPCDPAVVTGKPVSAVGVPDQLRTMTNYWLSTFEAENAAATNNEYSISALDPSLNETTSTDLITTTLSPLAENATTTDIPQVDFFQDLTELLARANSFGAEIKTCNDLKPYPMIDFSLDDNQLYVWVAALVATLFISKLVNYLVVKYSVKLRL